MYPCWIKYGKGVFLCSSSASVASGVMLVIVAKKRTDYQYILGVSI